MSVTSRELLAHMMEDLLEAEFRRFKRKLHEIQSDRERHIPRGLLENADALSTADLLLDYYGEGQATQITTLVLHLINKRDMASNLEAKLQGIVWTAGTPKTQDSNCQVLYKAAIRQRFSKVKDYNSLPGEWVDLEKRYIPLLIIKKHRNASEREQALLSRGQTHLEMLNKFQEGGTARAYMDSFLAADQNGQAPLTLILQGAAGIGKTYTLSKMMLDWASDRLYPERFDYVFHLNLKELSCEKRLVSLEDLILANFKGFRPSLDQILSRPEKLLFLLDGFDELNVFLSQAEDTSPVSTKSHYPTPVTVSLLLRRQLLPECSLLVTTRPTALEKLESCVSADCYLEVLGFLEEERQAFFYSYFEDDNLAFEAYSAIQENEPISTMCFEPMVCWIVCTVLKKQMETGCGLANIQTTTHIFLHFTQIMLQHHHCSFRGDRAQDNSRWEHVEKLGSLALHGILRQQVIFEANDLEAHNLEVSEIPTTFLNALLRQTVTVDTVYSFGHVTLQEFFAALFYFLASRKAGWKEDIKHLLEEGLKAENGHLLLVIRFLFGLSNHQSCQMLCQLSNGLSSSTTSINSIVKGPLLDWMRKAAQSPRLNDSHFHLELLHCLYEAHQEDLVKQAMAELDNIRFLVFPLKRSECLALAYCMQCCNVIQNLHLFCCGLGVEELKLLQPAFKKCLLLQLVVRCVPGDEILPFCSWAIPRHNPSEIILWKTQLFDAGLRQICTVLKLAKSQLKTFKISGNTLTRLCIPHLCAVVATNPLLTSLELSSSGLGDEAINLLCSELQLLATSLQYLNLEDNLLSKECVLGISALVTAVPTLTTLKLGFNKLADEGAQLLWPVLSDPLCRLVALGMEANNLTDECTETLAQSLLPNQTLEILLLIGNSLTTQSLPHLDLIWRECCSLHVINLTYNRIPKVDMRRYIMFYNAKAKRTFEAKENS
ncbi:NACHT, LRR and PYD domains-containing protein 3-like isoform X2 [Ambystoma mexicanum]|uniref:NACHT, LRR and PYD domains-containing protein 3-like isoform X2 n=1 Tax=Ambystoma mexicanum TaxID=8296 RepID=UPI0037E907DA